MGQKDMAEKLLADYNDVFADIVNVLLFDGRDEVSEDDLVETKVKSQYKADDSRLHEQERDVAKILKKDNVKIVLLGLENQTAIDADMPLRCLAYDGASYRSQLLNKSAERYPVITVVLYFGMDRWDKSRRLSETVHVTETWKPYFNDYHAHIFEIAYLSPEQVKMFKSDFGIVADYFVQKRMTGDYIGSSENIRHIDEVMKLLAVFADKRFMDSMVISSSKRRPKNMCEVLDRIEEKGRTEGRIEGHKQGFEQGMEIGILKGQIIMLSDTFGYSDKEIANTLNIPVSKVNNVLKNR